MKCAQSNSYIQNLLAGLDQDCFGMYDTATLNMNKNMIAESHLMVARHICKGKVGGLDEALHVDAQIEGKNTPAVGLSRSAVSGNGNDSMQMSDVFSSSSTAAVSSKSSLFEKMSRNLDPTLVVGMVSILVGVGILKVAEWFEPQANSEY
jgi:hypothetical protein